MKKLLLLSLLFVSKPLFAQEDGRFGLTAGLNEYYMDADFLFSKSGLGFSIGAVSTLPVSEHSEFLVELNLSRYTLELLGRETYTSNPEWIKFTLDKINFSVIYDYDLVHFLNEDLALGLCAGPSISFLQDFRIDDDSKEDYLLDPYYMTPDYLQIDTKNESISVNVFAAFGLSARYRNIEASLRYYMGITDTYRKFPAVSPYVEFTGKDDYGAFTVTYYFGDNF